MTHLTMFISASHIGTACGVLLVVSNEETHKQLLLKRGFITGNKAAEEKKMKSYDRVRLIQDAMITSAKDSGWTLIEQRVDPDPLDVVANELYKAQSCMMKDLFMDELEEDCQLPESSGDKKAFDDLIRAEQDGTIGKGSKPTQTGINNLVQNEKALMEAALAGKSALVLFYHTNSSVQLYLNFNCLCLIVFTNHMH